MTSINSHIPMHEVTAANAGLYANRLDPGHVRLFRIEQPSGRCSFETHALDQAPTYFCVSYTWGPSENTVYADEDVDTCDGVPRDLNISGRDVGSDDAYDEDKGDSDDDDDNAAFFLEAGGLRYRVSRNVHYLVTRLIAGGTSESLWIDALCINQADLVERSAQVGMMGDIFRSATNVLVWLGPDKRGEAGTVVRICRAVQAEFSRQLDGASTPTATVRRISTMFEPGLFESMGLPPGTDDTWTVFARFWNRRWFHRAWVIQEVTLTENPRFWWGSMELDRRMLFDVSCFLMQSGPWLAGRLDSSSGKSVSRKLVTLGRRIGETLATIKAFRRSVYLPPEEQHMANAFWHGCDTLAGPASIIGSQRTDCMRPWASMLASYRAFDATDPRDHVYATLGIIDAIAAKQGLTQPAVTVDYTRTVAEVFADAARCIVQTSNCINLVSLAQDPQMRKQPGLPSWVPDFSAGAQSPILVQKAARWKVMPRLYKLAQNAIECSSPPFEVQDNLRVLGGKGLRLDEIAAVGESHDELTNRGLWEKTAQILLSRPQISSRSAHESRIQSLWRTLVANASFSGEEIAPPEMAGDFKAFVTASLGMSLIHDADHLNRLPRWRAVTEIETRATSDGNGAVVLLPSFEEIGIKAMEAARRFKLLEAGREVPKGTPLGSRASRFASAMEPMYYRRLFITHGGYLGIGPLSTRARDTVWALPGAPLATVLRWVEEEEGHRAGGEKGRYITLGEAYLHGDPDFEAERADRGGWEWIELG